MDRSPRDTDNQYNTRRNETSRRYETRNDTYDTYSQPRTDSYLSTRQNYDRNSQNGHSTYHPRQPLNNDQAASSGRFRQDDERERAHVTYRVPSRLVTDTNQEMNRRSQPLDQTQSTPRVDYTVPQTQSGNPRPIVLDINISISIAGNRNPLITATAQAVPPRSTPIRSTAILEDVGYVDLDIRSPERTARLTTDGSIRSSPSKQSATVTHENHK